MTELKTAFGDPTHEGGDIELHEVALSAGSATLTYDEPFAEPPALIVSGPDGAGGWTARGAKQATISGTAEDTVFVLAVGER